MIIYCIELGHDSKAQRKEIKSTNNPLHPEMTTVTIVCEFYNMNEPGPRWEKGNFG